MKDSTKENIVNFLVLPILILLFIGLGYGFLIIIILLVITIMIFLVCLAVGCTHLGIADRQTMMERWKGQIAKNGVNEKTVWKITMYGNWAKKGTPTMPVAYLDDPEWERDLKTPNKISGGCAAQWQIKREIFNELGIPNKHVSCKIIRNDSWHPSPHGFLIVYLEGKSKIDDFNTWYTCDNGSVQDGIFPFGDVKRSTWGVTNWRVEE